MSDATSDPIRRLILELGRLPGIGERSAARLAYYILRVSQRQSGGPSLAADLARALLDAVGAVGLCDVCQDFCAGGRCPICRDQQRDPALLCVVEGVGDVRAIEASGVFRGRYHVLHGALAPLDGVGPEELKLDQLCERVAEGGVREVILATNADVDGDATALYIARLLRPLSVRVTRLASGVPLGGEIEYLDQATVGRAVSERREFA